MKTAGKVAVLALVVFTALLAVVAYLVSAGAAAGFDQTIRAGVHRLASPLFTRVMTGVTFLGSDLCLTLAGALFVWRTAVTGHRREAVLFIVIAIAAELVYGSLNLAFHRPRPEPFFGIPTPHGYSFPSGHTVKSTVFYGAMAMLARGEVWSRAAAVAVACAVGFSRIYLGVHYPTDVLGGYAVAAICLAALSLAYRRMPV